MKRKNTAWILVLGCGLALAANGVMLGIAALNRQGEPLSVLSLTERELALPAFRQEENSGFMLSLRLAHEVPYTLHRIARRKGRRIAPVEYHWFDRDKLIEIGFDLDVDLADPATPNCCRKTMSRPAFIVLENDGPAWSRWIAGREEQVRTMREEVSAGRETPETLEDAEDLLEWDRTMRSRLFPIDAGTDPNRLREQYPDGEKYSVIKAAVNLRVVYPKRGAPYLNGTIEYAMVSQIHVPIKFRNRLEEFLPEETYRESNEREREKMVKGELRWPASKPPRYTARLTFGSRNEPWLSSVKRRRV